LERVVITGVGVVSPIGYTFQDFMEGITARRKGIAAIRNFYADGAPSTFGNEIKPLGAQASRPHLKHPPFAPPMRGMRTGRPRSQETHVDKKFTFLERAIEELLQNNDTFCKYPPHHRMLNLGCGLDYFDLPGYVNNTNAEDNNWHEYSKNSYKTIQRLVAKYDIKGGFNVNVSACVASNHAIGLSFRILKRNKNRIIITGGVDSMLNPLHYMGFYKLGALSNWTGNPDDACRPFDKNRCGLVLGEGAAVLLLQNYEEAKPESILAEIVGYGSSMDAHTVTDPHPEGTFLAKAARDAICEAGITPDEIDCVHLHGTGTLKNALAEARTMKLIFGDRSSEIPVFSLKGQIGHLIAACGAVEMLGVIYSLQQQRVPPTVNFEEADPDVPLQVITGNPLEMDIRYVLKLNSAFGGQNAAFVMKNSR
jgi:3-oxoacyl-(acyl-carrier-protein) synthase